MPPIPPRPVGTSSPSPILGKGGASPLPSDDVNPFRQDPPFAVQVELSEGCNLRCSFCGLNGIRGKENDFKFMHPGTAMNIAIKLAEGGWNPRIEFAMHGEPSFNPHMIEILLAFRGILPSVQLMMTTNGGGFLKNPRLVDQVLESLNVLAMDWYENVSIVPRVLQGYQAAGGTVQPRYYPQDPEANPHHRRIPSQHEWVIIQDIAVATKGTHSLLNNHAGSGAPKNERMVGKRCAKPFREISIRWDGSVAVCCNDWRGEYRCGNVNDMSLEEIWNGPAMRAARAYLYHGQRTFGPCAGCDAVSYRTGLLPDKFGKLHLPEPTRGDAAAVAAALAAGPLTAPVPRPWEDEAGPGRVPLPLA